MDQNTGYRILDTEYWIQDTGYRILDTGYWIQDTGYRILSFSEMLLDLVILNLTQSYSRIKIQDRLPD